MTREKIMVDLFDFSPPTYYRWTKHEKRKIFDLLDYAFTNEELEEYLNTGKIIRVEKEKDFLIVEKSAITFFRNLANETDYKSLKEIIELLVEHYKENSNVISLELFAQKLYSKKIFSCLFDENNYNAKLNFKTIDIFKKEHEATLNYICRNYDNLKPDIEKIVEELNKRYLEIYDDEDYNYDSEDSYEDDGGPKLFYNYKIVDDDDEKTD